MEPNALRIGTHIGGGGLFSRKSRPPSPDQNEATDNIPLSPFHRNYSAEMFESGLTMVAPNPGYTKCRDQEISDSGSTSDIGGIEPIGSRHLYSRCDRVEGVSTFKTVASLVCVVGGTGTLGMPRAVAQAGWLGLLMILLALFMSAFTGRILIESLYLKAERRRTSFQEIAKDAFGLFGHHFAFGTVAINLFGCAVLYIILSATLIETMVQVYLANNTPLYFYIGACTFFVWACLIFTKTMKEVALLSILGVLATIIVVCISIGISVQKALDHAALTSTLHHKLVDWTRLPISLATISFAYGGNAVYPHVEQSMKHPHMWSTALWIALSFCFVMYLSIAIAGYTAFGESTMSPVLKNLPRAAPILLTSLAMMIEDCIQKRSPSFSQGSVPEQFLKRALPRTALMFLVGFVATVVPLFDDVMDLLGAMSTCLLVFVMPILFYYRLGGFINQGRMVRLWAGCILAVGTVAMVLGTVDAVHHLKNDLQQHK
ncbi:hypothetical protein BG011_006253 [Mortierella polycephala]|uniref:Amino acid transporter transmembrane domain-containing protein n=1 Tax=Mortierella polycephala TaxID=41804 RepID=A0A9P6TZV8_9FUNG|nr:hypothetical protein BG011_006253 [Mortierella polycephala]